VLRVPPSRAMDRAGPKVFGIEPAPCSNPSGGSYRLGHHLHQGQAIGPVSGRCAAKSRFSRRRCPHGPPAGRRRPDVVGGGSCRSSMLRRAHAPRIDPHRASLRATPGPPDQLGRGCPSCPQHRSQQAGSGLPSGQGQDPVDHLIDALSGRIERSHGASGARPDAKGAAGSPESRDRADVERGVVAASTSLSIRRSPVRSPFNGIHVRLVDLAKELAA